MKTKFLAALLCILALLPVSAVITRDATASWTRITAPATFNAAASSKLVVVISGEHNFANNFTGTCSAVTYNGQPLIRTANRAPANPSTGGHGQTHSSIWYLDNPGNFSGTGSIVVTCTGTSWVATAIRLSGTLPGVGPIATASGAASTTVNTNSYGSMIIAACGMGGQGNTATPLPGVSASIPSQAITIPGLAIGSSWAGHAVASAVIAMPSSQPITFNTAKTDVVTVAAAFADANPVLPAGPTPSVTDIIPGQSVGLTWNNFLPNTGNNVWVDVWLGNSPSNLQQVVSANPAGLNLTTTTFTAPAPGVYYGRIDSYLQGTSSGTPFAGTPFSFEVSSAGLRAETRTGLRSLSSILLLQREGIAVRPPDQSLRLNSSSMTLPVPSGVRLRGLFTPETTGAYTFNVAGSENSTLWLSSNDSRFNKQRIAYQLYSTAVAEWNKYATQKSAAMQLQAGVSYYIEAQVMNSIGNGHISIAWTPPGATTPALIPVARLSSLPADPADANDNNLPNSWETSTGLEVSTLPGASTEYGDPDNDGITNFDEYKLGSNPLAKDALADGLTRDTWGNVLTGFILSDFTSNRALSLNYPNETVHVPGIDDNARGEYYVSRYRGFITAPTTGDYRFWIAGNKKCELWLADGSVKYPGSSTPLTNRFGKQRIALNADPNIISSTARYEYDKYLEQRSRIVSLVQGQSYYIEVLHKQLENAAVNHVAVAWQPPGQARVLIPSTAFTSDIPDNSDPDADFLPSSWETQYGLNPTNSGVTDARDGQYGDWDADGLTNLDEFQLGTDPKKSDTDNDGITDKVERDYYKSNPLVSNLVANSIYKSISFNSYSNSNMIWKYASDGSVNFESRRGWIDYPFNISAGDAGAYELEMISSLIGSGVRSSETVQFEFFMNGSMVSPSSLVYTNGQNNNHKILLPWLKPGNHVLRIYNYNPRSECYVRIQNLLINRLGGIDVNTNGIPDWYETRLIEENKITVLPSQSFTSPACIEGKTMSHNQVSITHSISSSIISNQDDVIDSINDGFYSNIPLDAKELTNITISFIDGVFEAQNTIEWKTTNTLAVSTIDVRKNDSLKLSAWGIGQAVDGNYKLKINNQVVYGEDGLELIESSKPTIWKFSSSGVHIINIQWLNTAGAITNHSVTVNVISADFPQAVDVLSRNTRNWSSFGLDNRINVDADSSLSWGELNPSSSARNFAVTAYKNGTSFFLARMPNSSAILARGEVKAFSVLNEGRTAETRFEYERSDGTHVYSFTIIGEMVPENAEIRLRTHFQGAVFSNGSRDLTLTSADFDDQGIAKVYIEWGDSTAHRICHTVKVFIVDP